MVFKLFKRKKAAEKDPRYLTLKIREVIEVARDTVNVLFEKPEGHFEYQPGQFITIIAEISGKKVRRAYSLCTTPFEDQYPAVTVRRVPGGQMSNFICDHFKAGDLVEIMEPMGMFTTTYDASNKRKAIFLGGGSGITPLISIIRSSLIKEPGTDITLVYCNRSKEYIAFLDLLTKMESDYPGRFKVIHILEEDQEGMSAYQGRPTEDIVARICDQVGISPSTEFYICGPEPMMNIMNTGLQQVGIKEDQIRMESFEAGKTSAHELEEKKEGSVESSQVTILMDGEEFNILVPEGMSILDAGLDNDLDMPYSCQSGMCTACRGKCLEGEISLDDAEGISQDEIDEGYRLLCVGKALSDKVVVEIG